MSWTTPGTAVAGSVLTAAFWNAHVRDNEIILKTQTLDNGHPYVAVLSKAIDYTLLATDDCVVFTVTKTATLPASPVTGKPYLIKSIGAGVVVTVAGNGHNIDDASTFELGEFDGASFVYNGSTWSIY